MRVQRFIERLKADPEFSALWKQAEPYLQMAKMIGINVENAIANADFVYVEKLMNRIMEIWNEAEQGPTGSSRS